MKKVRKFLAPFAAAVALAACAAPVDTEALAGEDERLCLDASTFGVLRDRVCATTDLGVNYFSCIKATPIFGVSACFGKYSAVIGRDYHYCSAGDADCG